MKNILLIAALFITTPLFSQGYYEISLKKVHTETKNFKIVDVIDGRQGQNNIGFVQTGLFNKKKTAVFREPFVEALNILIEQNPPPGDIPIAIRVNHLHISEQTRAMSETAKAELALDFFLVEGPDRYYFLVRNYSSIESGGMDATGFHRQNIEAVLSKGIQQFAERDWQNLIDSTSIFSKKELTEGARKKVDPVNFAILKAEKYKEGVYDSFDDFLNNDPSITDNYRIKAGKKAKLWITQNGSQKRIKEDVYGFAHKNQLYVLFHKNFYPLEKKNNTFYFTGPHIPDQGAAVMGGVLGGAIGGAIAAAAIGGRYTYKIDLTSGSILLKDSEGMLVEETGSTKVEEKKDGF